MARLAQLARALLRLFLVAAAWLAAKALWGLLADDGPRALVDALTLHKLGELLVLGPWLLRAARPGPGAPPRGPWRACLAAGGVLNAVAWFDLAQRTNWAWWCWVLVGASLAGLGSGGRRQALRVGAVLLAGAWFAAAAAGVGPAGSGHVWYPILGSPPAPVAAELEPSRRRVMLWRGDLAFLERELERLHPNVFHTLDEEVYRDGFRQLAERVEELDDGSVAVWLEALVAGVGDSHTRLSPRYRHGAPFERLPLDLEWFRDGLFVTWAPPELSDLCGARVERFEALSAEAALAQVGRVIAHENRSWLLHRSPEALVNTGLLYRLGCLPEADRAELTLVQDGVRERQVIGAVPFGARLEWTSRREAVPLRDSRAEPFWYERLEEHAAVYVRYARCVDPFGFRRFAKELLAELRREPPERVLVDLRGNTGGSSLQFTRFLLPELAGGTWDEPDRLLCLIDRSTWSSGQRAALELTMETDATLIGEPTGGRVNACGEVRSFELPGTGLEVHHSTRHHLDYPEADDDAVHPDVSIGLSYEDWVLGRDPVLEFALRYAAPAQRRP